MSAVRRPWPQRGGLYAQPLWCSVMPPVERDNMESRRVQHACMHISCWSYGRGSTHGMHARRAHDTDATLSPALALQRSDSDSSGLLLDGAAGEPRDALNGGLGPR